MYMIKYWIHVYVHKIKHYAFRKNKGEKAIHYASFYI